MRVSVVKSCGSPLNASCCNDNKLLSHLASHFFVIKKIDFKVFVSPRPTKRFVLRKLQNKLHTVILSQSYNPLFNCISGYFTLGRLYELRRIISVDTRLLNQTVLVICIWRHQKHDFDQFAPNFEMGCKIIQHISVPNLKLFGQTKTELWAKEVGELSIKLYGKMGWWAFFCTPTSPPQYKCVEIF